jgi:hypothetical protein
MYLHGVFSKGQEDKALQYVNMNHHRLCSLHFTADSFLTSKHDKLTRRAVPVDYRTVVPDCDMASFDVTKTIRKYTRS